MKLTMHENTLWFTTPDTFISLRKFMTSMPHWNGGCRDKRERNRILDGKGGSIQHYNQYGAVSNFKICVVTSSKTCQLLWRTRHSWGYLTLVNEKHFQATCRCHAAVHVTRGLIYARLGHSMILALLLLKSWTVASEIFPGLRAHGEPVKTSSSLFSHNLRYVI